MIRLSLVVPVYGVEKYIHRFLASLEKNLQPEMEVLIINDGTKDNSAIIAEKFANKHCNYVKVINKSNGGVSSAWNKGLEIAKGEYVIFPDPDDFLAEDYVSNILKAIVDFNNPDMIFFDYYSGSEGQGFKYNTVPDLEEGIVSKEMFIRTMIKDTYIKGTLWNKAIKKSLYNGLKFDVNIRLGEDYEMLTDLSLKMEHIVYIRKPLYYYVERESSITHNVTEKDLSKLLELNFVRQNKYSKIYQDLSIYVPVRASLTYLLKLFKDGRNDNTVKYEEYIKNNIRNIIFSSDFDVNEKKQCLLIYFNIARYYFRKKYKN